MPTLEETTYEAGRSALADQESLVAGSRQRTGTLLAAHALVASFLGAITVRARGLSAQVGSTFDPGDLSRPVTSPTRGLQRVGKPPRTTTTQLTSVCNAPVFLRIAEAVGDDRPGELRVTVWVHGGEDLARRARSHRGARRSSRRSVPPRVVDRRELARQPDPAPDGKWLAHDVLAEHRRPAAAGREQRRQDPHERRLAGSVRARGGALILNSSQDRGGKDPWVMAADR